jgi:hypothetical protein
MTQTNGHGFSLPPATNDDTIEDIKALAAKIPESLSVIERMPDSATPFEQKTHTLMLESVDKITQQWVDEMISLRDNTKIIEQMVIEQATKVKNELTRLHMLGVQAMRETQRGHQVIQQLGEELDAMMAQRTEH